mmetsp:Transcript_27563/g.82751  ORF Transcript_27563/g.82751 Transcript_27563/m.82751 type:complete len:170 (-) Transcript_27563:32-541(-)
MLRAFVLAAAASALEMGALVERARPFAATAHGSGADSWLVPGRLALGGEGCDGVDLVVLPADAPPSSGKTLRCPAATPEALYELIDALLGHWEGGGGGAGFAEGTELAAACTLAFLCDVDGEGALAAVGGDLPNSKKRFVQSIAKSCVTHKRLLRDRAMVDAGMPKGFL